MTTDQGGAEAALRALAADLVEELSAGRAIELSGDGEFLELATFNVRPFRRTVRTRSGRVVNEVVRGHPESRTGLGQPGAEAGSHIPQEAWLRGQQEWNRKGEAIWAANRWKDIDKDAAEEFSRHADAAHAHLAPDNEAPRLAQGYEHLHAAHQVATEKLLPRAATPEQKQSVHEAIGHISDRMREVDKAAEVKSTRTSRLTGGVPERAARAAEKMAEPAHPAVAAPLPKMPPPPTGAQAVHPGLGSHLGRMPGSTISQHELSSAVQPVAMKPPSPEAHALGAANKRLEGYAQREEGQRATDLRDHLAELRAAEAQQRAAAAESAGMAAPGQYKSLTDAEFHSHVQQMEAKVEQALRNGLATDQQHSLDGDGQVWSPERAALHTAIIKEYMARQVDVPSQRQALFMGGLPGAGKSSLLRNHPEIDRRNYATLNPDEFKEMLAEHGAIPEVEGLSPMERAALVHEESAYLTDMAAEELERRGKNVVWDVTMKNYGITADRVSHLKHDMGYQVHAMFLDIPVEKSADRVMSRYRRGLEAYRKGSDPLGGRFVPRHVVLAGEATPGVSRARETFEKLKPEFASWEQYDGSGGLGKLVVLSAATRGQGIPSVESLRTYTGATETQARAAETGTGSGTPGLF
jgi:predicted kinase